MSKVYNGENDVFYISEMDWILKAQIKKLIDMVNEYINNGIVWSSDVKANTGLIYSVCPECGDYLYIFTDRDSQIRELQQQNEELKSTIQSQSEYLDKLTAQLGDKQFGIQRWDAGAKND